MRDTNSDNKQKITIVIKGDLLFNANDHPIIQLNSWQELKNMPDIPALIITSEYQPLNKDCIEVLLQSLNYYNYVFGVYCDTLIDNKISYNISFCKNINHIAETPIIVKNLSMCEAPKYESIGIQTIIKNLSTKTMLHHVAQPLFTYKSDYSLKQVKEETIALCK